MIQNIFCENCQQHFAVTDSDQSFYKKIDVPLPKLCPDCRQQRRLAFRNERNLFKRKCDFCKRDIISFFDTDVPFPVYCSECWWSDKWDPLSYGQDFDFNKPFFTQFKGLMMKVPKTGMLHLNNENSEYNSLLAFSKNTYMSPGSYVMEDCYYVRKSQYCKNCINSNFIDHSELCAYCINCNNCYNSSNLVNCRNCVDAHYLANCNACQNCFMCSDVSSKKFCYKNKQLSEAEYKKVFDENMRKSREELLKEFKTFIKTVPKKYQNQLNCENSSGDYIQNCKNASHSYDCFGLEDCKYMVECVGVKDSMDLSMHDKEVELCYELSSGGDGSYNVNFSFCTCTSKNCSYMYSCFNMQDSFGCDSIHLKLKNCILNRQYSEADYKNLRAKIVEYMKKTGEWGEFFPISLSLYPYNFSYANDYYPMTEEQAKAKGYRWKAKNPAHYRPAKIKLPHNIKEIPETILKEILACESCGKNYQIIQPEYLLSKRLNQPLSRLCSDCRQLQLNSFKNPRKLWKRKCDKCGVQVESTYASEAEEKVYCGECYLTEVY